MPLYVAIGSKGLANIFTVTNKIKIPTIVTLVLAICSTLTVFVLLKFTNLGIYAIAISSSFYLCIKELIFVPLYAAKCLNTKITIFFGSIIKSVLIVVVSVAISSIIGANVIADTWLSLIKWAAISSLIVIFAIVLMLFRKRDYVKIINKFKKRSV